MKKIGILSSLLLVGLLDNAGAFEKVKDVSTSGCSKPFGYDTDSRHVQQTRYSAAKDEATALVIKNLQAQCTEFAKGSGLEYELTIGRFTYEKVSTEVPGFSQICASLKGQCNLN